MPQYRLNREGQKYLQFQGRFVAGVERTSPANFNAEILAVYETETHAIVCQRVRKRRREQAKGLLAVSEVKTFARLEEIPKFFRRTPLALELYEKLGIQK